MNFKTRITVANSLITVIAVAIIYYVAIKTITFTAETIKFISIVTVFIVIIALTIQYLASLRPFSTLLEFDKRLHDNTLDERFTKTAFYTAMFFPLYFMSVSAGQWYFASVIYFILLYAFSRAGLAIALKTTFAIVSGATIANIFQYFVYQRLTEPLIVRIQEHLKDTQIHLKKRAGIFTKIFVSSSLLIIIFLIFARTIGNELMEDALRTNGVESARLELTVSRARVDALLSQSLSPEQTAAALSKIRLGQNGYVLLMDSTYHDIFNISDNYTAELPLKKIAFKNTYNDPIIGATLIKLPLSSGLSLVGVYSWSDYAGLLTRFEDALNWLLLTVILLLIMVSLFVTIDIYLPMKAIGTSVEKLVSGNFSTLSGLFVEDEAGTIANNIRKTTEDIRSVLKSIKSASSNITDIADKMVASIDLAKENILILDKEIRNNADVIASVQQTLNHLTEYIEGLIHSINELLVNSGKLTELTDRGTTIFTGLTGSVETVLKSNEGIRTALAAVQKGIEENVTSGTIHSYDGLKTMSMKQEDAIKQTGIFIESLIENINKLSFEVKGGENNRQKMDMLFNGALITISSLNDNVEKIVVDLNKIDLVIDDTNLLAMNSSVISAQAGKAGKGFDVVSDEITKLASVTQTKILEVKNLTELLVKEKDTIKNNIYEKKKFIDTVDDKLTAFKDEIQTLTGGTVHINESYQNILRTMNILAAKRDSLFKDSMSEKEMHHLIRGKLPSLEKSIAGINMSAADLKNILDSMFKRWTTLTETMAPIPQELSSINEPAAAINGYMAVIKTKTAEIQTVLNRIAETSRQLNKQLGRLNIRTQIETIAATINEEPKRYRTL